MPPPRKSNNIKAFTLSETLITLAIIGIVAALTLPSIIQKHQERVRIVKLKKVYNILSTAFNAAVLENGKVNTWTTQLTNRNNTTEQDKDINNIMKQYLKYVKYCEKGNTSDCSHPAYYSVKNLKRRNDFNKVSPTIFLADGTMIKITTEAGDYESKWCIAPVTNTSNDYSRYMYRCGVIYVDLNGIKGPNIDGYDIFAFSFYQNTLSPLGLANDHPIDNFSMCIGTSSYSSEGRKAGGCTAWALINENLDYLHCPDELSWTGKKTCK